MSGITFSISRILLRPRAPRLQSIRPFRQSRSQEPKGGVGKDHVGAQPFVEAKNLPPASPADLLKPFLFAVGFSGASVSVCAIWQYEHMRQKAREARVGVWTEMRKMFGQAHETEPGSMKLGEIRQKINEWWNGLSEGQRVFWPICFLNAVVYAAWRVPHWQSFMLRYFCSNPASKAVCLPMILSAFSHYSIVHIACNMYVLHSFATPAVQMLGKEQFVAVYLSSGVLTSFASMVHKVATGRMGFSLGASGAICTVIGIFGTLIPDAKLQIVLLPMLTFSASTGIKALMAVDTAGIVAGWKFLDHAAHLSGVLFGIFWCRWGNEHIWKNREVVMAWWHHNVRGVKPPPS